MTAPVTVAELLDRIGAAIAAVVTDARQSVYHPAFMRDAGSTRTWSVEAPRTEITSPSKRFHQPRENEPGMQAQTTIRVRILVRLQDAGRTAYEAALTLERQVIDACRDTDVSGCSGLVLMGVEREPITFDEDVAGMLLTTITFVVSHLFAGN